MSIIEELVKQKKQIDLREVSEFAVKAGSALAEANKALEELQRKQRELKEENLTIATVNSLMNKISSFEGKFDTLVDYLKLSSDVLSQESALLTKIDKALKM